MSPKLTLSREKILSLIGLVGAYARRHEELLPPSEMGIDLAKYVSSGDFQREHEIEAGMPERNAFLRVLGSLSEVEMRELQGVMYLGRGDFDADAFWKNTNGLPIETDAAI